MLQLLDVVAVNKNLPDRKLNERQVGTVVEVYGQGAVEVEFIGEQTKECRLETLTEDDLYLFHRPPTKNK